MNVSIARFLAEEVRSVGLVATQAEIRLFPPPRFYERNAKFTNVRNTASSYWKRWLKPSQRASS